MVIVKDLGFPDTPGEIYETVKNAGIQVDYLINNTVSARDVAEDGYNGMLAGKLDVISGLTFGQKLMVSSIPFMPKKLILRQMRKMQEKTV